MPESPLTTVQKAIRAVPAVRFALGIAGIVAAIAIVKGFGLGLRVAGFGTVVMLVLMTTLVIFARLTTASVGMFQVPILIFTWSALFMTLATAFLLFTSIFFCWPVDLQYWLTGQPCKHIRASRVEITYPSDNQEVGAQVRIYGTKSGITDGQEVWVIVKSIESGRYFPQSHAAVDLVTDDATWTYDTCIGRPTTEEEGKQFEILACIVNRSAQDIFLQNVHTPCEDSLPKLPPGMTACAHRLVTRQIGIRLPVQQNR